MNTINTNISAVSSTTDIADLLWKVDYVANLIVNLAWLDRQAKDVEFAAKYSALPESRARFCAMAAAEESDKIDDLLAADPTLLDQAIGMYQRNVQFQEDNTESKAVLETLEAYKATLVRVTSIPAGRYGKGDSELGLAMHPQWPTFVKAWKARWGQRQLPCMVIVKPNGTIECYYPDYTNGPEFILPAGSI